jgi:hypothetical protein
LHYSPRRIIPEQIFPYPTACQFLASSMQLAKVLVIYSPTTLTFSVQTHARTCSQPSTNHGQHEIP